MTPQARRWLIAKYQELGLWGVFVVLAGLFPILVLYNQKRLVTQGPVNWAELILQGELLLVAFGIAADSTSRIVSQVFHPAKKKAKARPWQFTGMMTSIIFLVMAASEYSTVISVGKAIVNPDYVVHQSLILFVAALLTGGGLILLD